MSINQHRYNWTFYSIYNVRRILAFCAKSVSAHRYLEICETIYIYITRLYVFFDCSISVVLLFYLVLFVQLYISCIRQYSLLQQKSSFSYRAKIVCQTTRISNSLYYLSNCWIYLLSRKSSREFRLFYSIFYIYYSWISISSTDSFFYFLQNIWAVSGVFDY